MHITPELSQKIKAQTKQEDAEYQAKITKIEGELDELQRSIPEIKLADLERIRHKLIAISNFIQREFDEIDKDFD